VKEFFQHLKSASLGRLSLIDLARRYYTSVINLFLAVVFLVPTLSLAFSIAGSVSFIYGYSPLLWLISWPLGFVLGGVIGAGIGALLVIWTGGLLSVLLNIDKNLEHLAKKKES